MIDFINKKVFFLIGTFLKYETGPLADTSSYVDWLTPQGSPKPPSLPVQSSENRRTDCRVASSVEAQHNWMREQRTK